MAHAFLDRLQAGPIVCDGAIGTQLYARGVSYDRCFDELVVSQPDLVESVHYDYLLAGAEIIETNTFGANRIRLAGHGLSDNVALYNARAVEIARRKRRPAFCQQAPGCLLLNIGVQRLDSRPLTELGAGFLCLSKRF